MSYCPTRGKSAAHLLRRYIGSGIKASSGLHPHWQRLLVSAQRIPNPDSFLRCVLPTEDSIGLCERARACSKSRIWRQIRSKVDGLEDGYLDGREVGKENRLSGELLTNSLP